MKMFFGCLDSHVKGNKIREKDLKFFKKPSQHTSTLSLATGRFQSSHRKDIRMDIQFHPGHSATLLPGWGEERQMGNQTQAHSFPSHAKRNTIKWLKNWETTIFCSRIEQFVQACAGQTPSVTPKTSISYLMPFLDDKFSNLENKTYKQHPPPKNKWQYFS